jgi:FkbM family methyltransferase
MLIDFRELFPKYNIKPKGVLHVGANVGEEAQVYDELGIKNVVWIEANTEIFHKLLNNVGGYGHNCFNVCISDKEGEPVTLHISNNGSQSSSILELGTHKIAHPEVHYIKDVEMKAQRLDQMLILWDILKDSDFLNIDLQGAELKALRGMGDRLNQFKWAYLEVNQAELYKGCALVEEIDTYLLGFGFKRVETKWCGNTGWGDALYIKGR